MLEREKRRKNLVVIVVLLTEEEWVCPCECPEMKNVVLAGRLCFHYIIYFYSKVCTKRFGGIILYKKGETIQNNNES